MGTRLQTRRSAGRSRRRRAAPMPRSSRLLAQFQVLAASTSSSSSTQPMASAEEQRRQLLQSLGVSTVDEVRARRGCALEAAAARRVDLRSRRPAIMVSISAATSSIGRAAEPDQEPDQEIRRCRSRARLASAATEELHRRQAQRQLSAASPVLVAPAPEFKSDVNCNQLSRYFK